MHSIDRLSPEVIWQGSHSIIQNEDEKESAALVPVPSPAPAISTWIVSFFRSQTIENTPLIPPTPLDEKEFLVLSAAPVALTVYPVNLLKKVASDFALLRYNPSEFSPLWERVAGLKDAQLDIEFVALLTPFVVALQLAEKRDCLRTTYKSAKKFNRPYLFKHCKREYYYDRDGGRHCRLNARRLNILCQNIKTKKTELLNKGSEWANGRSRNNPEEAIHAGQKYLALEQEWQIMEFQAIAALTVQAQFEAEEKAEVTAALYGFSFFSLLMVSSYFLPLSPTMLIGGINATLWGGWKGKRMLDRFVSNWLRNQGPLNALPQTIASPSQSVIGNYQFFKQSTGPFRRLMGKGSKSSGLLQIGAHVIPFKAKEGTPTIQRQDLIALRSLIIQALDAGKLTYQQCLEGLETLTKTPILHDGTVVAQKIISNEELEEIFLPLVLRYSSRIAEEA